MSVLSSHLNRLSPVLEVESKSHHDSFSAIRVGFTQKATEEQEKIRDHFLTEKTTVIPASSSYPSFTFTQKEISSYLQKYLDRLGLLEEGPFFVGGVATHLMVEPEYALEFSDYDICFQLKVPAYEAIQNAFIDFFREKLTHLLKDFHYLNSKQGSEMSALLQNPKCDHLIAQAYLYKKNMLTNHQDLLGGSFFRLGLFEFKFFYKMVCRQNVFKSDGFRFPLFGDQIFCVDVDSLCTQEEFELALVAARKRHCLITKPEETKDYLFKVVQKATQGFEFFQKDAIEPALIQFDQTFFLEKKELLGTKLHNHQINHYVDNAVGTLFDFMNFLIFFGQNRDDQAPISQLSVFANAWLKEALLPQKRSLVGECALLVAKFPEKAMHLIHLIQGFLLHQLVKKNPKISGYLFNHDPLTIHHALAIKLSIGKKERTSYLRTQNLPASLATQFLESWSALEEMTLEIQPFLKTFFQECGFEGLEFSKKCKVIVIQDLFLKLENSGLIADPKGGQRPSENYLPFYNFLLNSSDSVVDRSLLEMKVLEKALLRHLEEAVKFKEETIISLITLILSNFKRLEIADLLRIPPLLKAIAEKKIVLNSHLKEGLGDGLLKILTTLKFSWDLRSILLYSHILGMGNQLEIFTVFQQKALFSLTSAACTTLIHSKNLDDFPIVFENLLAISHLPQQSEEMEKEVFEILKQLSDQLHSTLEKLTLDLSKLSLRDFKAVCNGLSICAHLHSLKLASHFKEAHEITHRVFMHALQSKDPSFIYLAGLTALKMFKWRFLAQEHLIQAFYLAERLLVSSHAESDEEASELALKICSEFGKEMGEALQTHEKKSQWHYAIQIQFIKNMSKSLFAKKLSDFKRNSEVREKNFHLFFRAFSLLPHLTESQKTYLKKIQALNFKEEHFQIRMLFFNFVAELDSEFALQIFKRCPAEMLPVHGLIESSKSFIENQSESSLNSAYKMWLLNIRSPEAIKKSPIHCIKSTFNLLSALLKADGKIAIQRIHFLVESLCLFFKEISFRKKEWEELVSDQRGILQKEAITLFKRLIERADLALLESIEILITWIEKAEMIPLNETGKLVYQLLDRHRTIETFPKQMLIHFYLERLLPKWEEKVGKRENDRVLSASTNLLIKLCIEKSHERYDAFALELFEKALKGEFLLFDQECERFFFSLIHHFPMEWKNSLIPSQKIEEFISVIKEKKFLNRLSPQVKIAFFDSLLSFENTYFFHFIWEEIQKIVPSTEVLHLEMVKFCRRFCQKIARSKERDFMQIACHVLNFFKKPDAQMFIHFTEGLLDVSEVTFFEFALVYAQLLGQTSFSLTLQALPSRHLIECAMNIALAYKKAEDLKASLPYRQFVEEGYRIMASSPPEDPNFDLLNVKMVTFLIQLDSLKDLWRAFDVVSSTRSARVVQLFKRLLTAVFKRWNGIELIKKREMLCLNKKISDFFAFHSSFLSSKDLEECVESFRPFFEDVSLALTIGVTFLKAFKGSADLKNKLDAGKNLNALYSPKIEQILSYYLLKMGAIYKFESQFLELSQLYDYTKKMLSAPHQESIIKFIKDVLESHYEELFSGNFFLKSESNSEIFASTLLKLEEFVTTYAKFDPEKIYHLVKKWTNSLIPHKTDKPCLIRILDSHLLMKVGLLLNLCFSLKIFEQKSSAWGQVGVPSEKALKLAQLELFNLGCRVIPLLCENRNGETFNTAMELLENCTSIANLTNLDKVRLLHCCYSDFHQRAMVDTFIHHDTKSHGRFQFVFLNFLEILVDQKESPQKQKIVLETLAQIQIFTVRLISSHYVLKRSLEEGEGGVDLSMRFINAAVNFNNRLLTVLQNLNLIRDIFNFKNEKLVQVLAPSCLKAFITCDSSEMKKVLDQKSLETMVRALTIFMILLLKSRFFSVYKASLQEEMIEIFFLVKNLAAPLLPPEFAKIIEDRINNIFSHPLSSEKKV